MPRLQLSTPNLKDGRSCREVFPETQAKLTVLIRSARASRGASRARVGHMVGRDCRARTVPGRAEARGGSATAIAYSRLRRAPAHPRRRRRSAQMQLLYRVGHLGSRPRVRDLAMSTDNPAQEHNLDTVRLAPQAHQIRRGTAENYGERSQARWGRAVAVRTGQHPNPPRMPAASQADVTSRSAARPGCGAGAPVPAERQTSQVHQDSKQPRTTALGERCSTGPGQLIAGARSDRGQLAFEKRFRQRVLPAERSPVTQP